MGFSTVSEIKAERVFVIGDTHGCSEETVVLLRFLERERGFTDLDSAVFLGDYIDRGPDSMGVVDVALEWKRHYPLTRFLKGNHEDMLLDFLGFGGKFGEAFLYNGGVETITSYGISVFAPPEEIATAMPPEHFRFFCELESILTHNNLIFVHAGLNPMRELTAQIDSDVLWIRDEFLNYVHSFKKVIIFGHTPHRDLFLHRPFKIGLDTGLVFGNKLSCIDLSTGEVLQVARGAKEVSIGEPITLSEWNFDTTNKVG